MEKEKTIVIPLDLNPNVHWGIIETVCSTFHDFSVTIIGVVTDSNFKMPSASNFDWRVGCPYDSDNLGYLQGASCVLLVFRGDCVLDVRFPGPTRGTGIPTVAYIPGRYGVGGYNIFRAKSEEDVVYQINLALGRADSRPKGSSEERVLEAIGDYMKKEGIGSAAYNGRNPS